MKQWERIHRSLEERLLLLSIALEIARGEQAVFLPAPLGPSPTDEMDDPLEPSGPTTTTDDPHHPDGAVLLQDQDKEVILTI